MKNSITTVALAGLALSTLTISQASAAPKWAKSGDTSLKIEKKKLGFKAIAVVAAINIQGQVVALLIKDKSIITSDF